MTSTQPAPDGALPSVGGYVLLARLGEGGMGIVHLARRERDGERVALKVLRPQIVGDEEGRARLAREVGSLSRVRSRWVAEIVDADPWGEVPWIATRYVPGLSLHEYVDEEGPVSGRDLIWFATCLAEGLVSVHEAGVLHRDVKPANVLMEGRTPILIDFGLARVADDPRLTHTGWLMGTPGYLAPEILYGDDATTASDVHSWAATVAFAATGRPPFGRGPGMAIMDRVRRGEHDLGGVPDGLVGLLTACLDPEPWQRPTLREILDHLRPGLDPVPQAAAAAPAAEREPYTMPLVAGERPGEVSGTLRLPEDPTLANADSEPGWSPAWTPEPAPGWLERLGRATLLTLTALGWGAGAAAYPWPTLTALVVVVWLLRSGSLAASAVGERRRLRGPKWYDAPQLVLRSPWDLLRSVPGTIVLVLWSAGLAVAAALLCYAVAAGEEFTLFATGLAFAAALWCGPGASRVRSPIGRVVRPLSRDWRPWLAAAVVLLIIALGLGALAQSRGTDWLPGTDRPLAGQTEGQPTAEVARW